MRYFAKTALGYNPKEHLDISFAMLCLNSNKVERDVVVHYLKNRLPDTHLPDELSNYEIHANLVKALGVIKKEGSVKKRPLNLRQKVVLD
jgi:hypothetical protein